MKRCRGSVSSSGFRSVQISGDNATSPLVKVLFFCKSNRLFTCESIICSASNRLVMSKDDGQGRFKGLSVTTRAETSIQWIFFTDAAFVVITQSNLRYVNSLKPNQLDMWVMEQEKATGLVCPVSAMVSDNYEIAEDKGGHSWNLSFHRSYCSFFLLPKFFCTFVVSLSCVTKQPWLAKEGRRRSSHFLICKTILYFLPCNVSAFTRISPNAE